MCRAEKELPTRTVGRFLRGFFSLARSSLFVPYHIVTSHYDPYSVRNVNRSLKLGNGDWAEENV